MKLVPNLSYSNNLSKIRVVLGVFRHVESKSSLYYVLSLFLKEVLVILCWNPWQLFQVLETRHFFGQNWAVRFCRITSFSPTIANAIEFKFFWKEESKKIIQWLWDQNRKNSIDLKQSISKPAENVSWLAPVILIYCLLNQKSDKMKVYTAFDLATWIGTDKFSKFQFKKVIFISYHFVKYLMMLKISI